LQSKYIIDEISSLEWQLTSVAGANENDEALEAGLSSSFRGLAAGGVEYRQTTKPPTRIAPVRKPIANNPTVFSLPFRLAMSRLLPNTI